MRYPLFSQRLPFSLITLAILFACYASTANGATRAWLVGGTLYVAGDRNENEIYIRKYDYGNKVQVVVEANNGRLGRLLHLGVFQPKSIVVAAFDGDDKIEINDVTIPGFIQVQGGKGADDTTLGGSEISGDVLIDSGPSSYLSEQSISVADTIIKGDLRALPGYGELPKGVYHSLILERSYVWGNIQILNHRELPEALVGRRTCRLDDSYVFGDVKIQTGTDSDYVRMDDTKLFGDVMIDTGDGRDFVIIAHSVLQANLLVETRQGDDDIDVYFSRIRGLAFLATGDHRDYVRFLADQFDETVIVMLEGGNDEIEIDHTEVGGWGISADLALYGGDGYDLYRAATYYTSGYFFADGFEN